MPIASYNDLVSKIPLWAERADLADVTPDFIYLAEADANAVLRVPAMENMEDLVVTDGRVEIPFDFMELKWLTVEGEHQDTTLQYISWDQFVKANRDRGQHLGTVPKYFSRQGGKWYVTPVPANGSVVHCNYYRFIPPLDNIQQRNWLVQVSPQAYLFGGLKHLHDFIMDQDRAAYWSNRFDAELAKIQNMADSSEYEGSILNVKPSEF